MCMYMCVCVCSVSYQFEGFITNIRLYDVTIRLLQTGLINAMLFNLNISTTVVNIYISTTEPTSYVTFDQHPCNAACL